MTQNGFYVDTDICIGCKACMTSCFDRNDLEVPQKYRKVWEFGGGAWEDDGHGAFTSTSFAYYVSMTCGQCDHPACVERCPTGSMRKDLETGLVNNDKETCIGCMTCETVCPYHHPTKMADGLSHKCVMCTDRSETGKPEPACEKACPVRAIVFGPIDELRERYGRVDALGTLANTTGPQVVFAPHRDADKGGELMNPLEVSHEEA
ncbi:4Fe-4S binding protein [Eggerthellaceae bacterium zg-1084]|uniref:4Fe-4S dicluster domain-containing protein n=1 Tax=Berryella wangjianweii TaxID=2734634 RepID=UPI0015582F97|nr:4Fe-4S dicluster domain-containing protein [Berryella wangjianweii]NPD30694.1 4Fe-4S binding protein [Berryella wangjianweii]